MVSVVTTGGIIFIIRSAVLPPNDAESSSMNRPSALAVFGYISGEETTEIRRIIEAVADVNLRLSNTEFIFPLYSMTKHRPVYLMALAYLIVRASGIGITSVILSESIILSDVLVDPSSSVNRTTLASNFLMTNVCDITADIGSSEF